MAHRIGLFVALAVLCLALDVLAGCDVPQTQLVCTRAGKEVFRSAPADSVWQRDKADSWSIDGDSYLPEPGTSCRRVEVYHPAQ